MYAPGSHAGEGGGGEREKNKCSAESHGAGNTRSILHARASLETTFGQKRKVLRDLLGSLGCESLHFCRTENADQVMM